MARKIINLSSSAVTLNLPYVGEFGYPGATLAPTGKSGDNITVSNSVYEQISGIKSLIDGGIVNVVNTAADEDPGKGLEFANTGTINDTESEAFAHNLGTKFVQVTAYISDVVAAQSDGTNPGLIITATDNNTITVENAGLAQIAIGDLVLRVSE